MVARGELGRMVALQANETVSVPIEDVAGRLRRVTPDHALVRAARSLGVNLGVPAGSPMEEFYEEHTAKA
jgi:6-phosphofructokinase 1